MWEAVDFSKSSLGKSYTSKTLRNFIPNGSVASEHIYVGSQFWQEQGYVNLSKSLLKTVIIVVGGRQADGV